MFTYFCMPREMTEGARLLHSADLDDMRAALSDDEHDDVKAPSPNRHLTQDCLRLIEVARG